MCVCVCRSYIPVCARIGACVHRFGGAASCVRYVDLDLGIGKGIEGVGTITER